jgi:hypothetical protein
MRIRVGGELEGDLGRVRSGLGRQRSADGGYRRRRDPGDGEFIDFPRSKNQNWFKEMRTGMIGRGEPNLGVGDLRCCPIRRRTVAIVAVFR